MPRSHPSHPHVYDSLPLPTWTLLMCSVSAVVSSKTSVQPVYPHAWIEGAPWTDEADEFDLRCEAVMIFGWWT